MTWLHYLVLATQISLVIQMIIKKPIWKQKEKKTSTIAAFQIDDISALKLCLYMHGSNALCCVWNHFHLLKTQFIGVNSSKTAYCGIPMFNILNYVQRYLRKKVMNVLLDRFCVIADDWADGNTHYVAGFATFLVENAEVTRLLWT